MISDVTASNASRDPYSLTNGHRNSFLNFFSRYSLELFLAGCWLSVLFSELLALFFYPLWTIGDWLINYSHGFVRRGLPGQIILSLAHLLHIPPTITTLIVHMILYTAFLAGVYSLAKPLRRDVVWYSLVFSPATMAFMAINISNGCRKELLLHLALVTIILLVLRKVNFIVLSITLTLLLPALVLSHEIMASCFPYFFAAVAIGTGSLRRSAGILALPFIAATVAVIIVRHYIGSLPVAMGICQSIGGRWVGTFNTGPNLCGGAIGHLTWTVNMYIQEEHNFRGFWPLYTLCGILAFLPLVAALVVLYRRDGRHFDVKVIACTALLSAIATVPIFLVAVDWGRWIFMQTVCFMLVILMAAHNAPRFLKTSTSPPIGAGKPWRKPLLVAAVLYCTCWTLPVIGINSQRFGYLGVPHAILSQAHYILHQQKYSETDRGF